MCVPTHPVLLNLIHHCDNFPDVSFDNNFYVLFFSCQELAHVRIMVFISNEIANVFQ